MSNDALEFVNQSRDVEAALMCVNDALIGTLHHMLKQLYMDELTAAELAALYAVIRPVYERVEHEPAECHLRLVTHLG